MTSHIYEVKKSELKHHNYEMNIEQCLNFSSVCHNFYLKSMTYCVNFDLVSQFHIVVLKFQGFTT